ncbi:MAG: hypothetical protein AAGJ39_09765, partial [Pseudomonadota bacterium]
MKHPKPGKRKPKLNGPRARPTMGRWVELIWHDPDQAPLRHILAPWQNAAPVTPASERSGKMVGQPHRQLDDGECRV